MATTMIDMTEEDQAGFLISFLLGKTETEAAEAPSAAAICAGTEWEVPMKKAVDTGNYAALLKAFHEALIPQFGTATEQEIESAHLVLYNLLMGDNNAKVEELGVSIADALTSKVDDSAALRLKLVVLLYNHLDSKSGLRYQLLLKIIKYATSANLLAGFLTYLSGIDNLTKDWKLSDKQRSDLYLQIYESLKSAGESAEAYKMLLKYLHVADASSTAQAAEATKLAIDSDTMYQMDSLLHLEAVKALQKKEKSLYDLLTIFVSGDYTEFTEFYKKNKKVVDSISTKEKCEKKMRLLTLVSIACEKTQLPYSEVKEKLKIDTASDVEGWFIAAISAKLLEGKMNQQTELITITKCTHRVFNTGEWEKLAGCAQEWKGSMTSLLEVLDNAKPPSS